MRPIRPTLDQWRSVVDRSGSLGWWASVAIGFAVGLVELAAAGVILLALQLADAGSNPSVPLVGDLREALPGTDPDADLRWFAVVALGFFGFRALLLAAQAYFSYRVAFSLGARTSLRGFRQVLSMPFRWHLSQTSSGLATTVTQTVQQFVVYVFAPSVAVASQVILVFLLLGAVLIAEPALALVAIASLAATSLVTLALTNRRLQRLGEIDLAENRASTQVALESLAGIREIRVFGAESQVEDRLRASRTRQAHANYLRSTLTALPRIVIESVSMVAVLGWLLWQGAQDNADLAAFGAIAYVILRTLPTLNSLVANLNTIRFGQPSLRELHRLLSDAPAPDVEAPASEPLKAPVLELRGVGYSYDEQAVLHGIDLTVPFGRTLGIVGPTGSGKSTLLDILAGLLTPDSGEILVNGEPLADVRGAWFRSIGIVPQQIFVLDSTLRENVTLSALETDEDRFEVSLHEAQLDEVVASLPDGVDTGLGERGVRLSGGQRQRVALARALYRAPSVLLLDEGTSALDMETERAVMAALVGTTQPRTAVLVTHRLATAESCDEIVVLDSGRIVAKGTYEELLRSSDVFRRLALQDNRSDE